VSAGTLVELERAKRQPWAEPLRRPWGARPSRIGNVLVVAALLVYLWCRTDADAPFGGASGWGTFIAGVFGMAWVCRRLNRWGRRLVLTRKEARAWLVLPIAIGVALIDYRFDAMFRVNFALSEPTLRAAAERIPDGTKDPVWSEQRIGLFRVFLQSRERGVARLWTTRSELFTYCGFAYAPGDPPTGDANTEYRHVSGPWWVWGWSSPYED
jgi:hypothetical protein